MAMTRGDQPTQGRQVILTFLFAVGAALVRVPLRPTPAAAAGVVGTGTAASCTDAALDAAVAGGGLVTFNCGPAPVTIDISTGTGTKTITADTTIDGGGSITISGGDAVGVFEVPDGVTLNLHGVVFSNAGGTAISNSGTLSVTNSTFSNNTFSGATTSCTFFGNGGGAISNCGTLSVTNSTFSDNVGGGLGGAIFNSGTLVVSGSTFVGNALICFLCNGAGGAIFNEGTLTVSNSTFVENRGDPGAIFNLGALSVTNSTFVNSTFVGKSIVNSSLCGDHAATPCPAVLRNTIVAGRPSDDNCFGLVTDGGHNIEDGTSCGFSTANGSLSSTSPQLDPAGLQDNGGLTQTVALCAGVGTPTGCTAASPAIDAGDESVCAAAPVNGADQRGHARPGAGHAQCSVGAYEADVLPPCVGDCDHDGAVAIDELILGVNIVLDLQPTSACPAFASSEGMVDIAQLITGVNDALGACGNG